jgi:hypothetical protein
MKAEHLISCAMLNPYKARKLVCAVDEAWASVADNYAADRRAIESFRLELATIMLALAHDDQRDMEDIKTFAIGLLL